MKNILLIVISILLGQSSFSQDCADFLKKDVTNYTDTKKVETIWIEGIKNEVYIKFNLERRKLEINYSSNSKEISNKNDTLILNFENGKESILAAPRSGSDVFSYTDGISTKWKNSYLGNLEIFDNFISSKLLNIKEKKSGLIIELKGKQANKIIDGANCFYSQIDTLKDIQPYYLERKNKNCDFFEYKIDNFTNEIRKRDAYTTIGFKGQANKSNGFALVCSLFDFGSGIGLDIRVNSYDYCSNDDSYIMIKLANDEIIKIKSSSGINCGEGTTLKCYLNDSDVIKLQESNIKVVRLMTADGFIDIENISSPAYFSNHLKCFIE